MTNTTWLSEPARTIQLLGEYDVVVLGGGPAGIAAAAAAGRNGASVFLAEHYGFLGGMGTAGGVTNFCGLHANVHGDIRQVVHGIADDLLQRMRELDGLNDPHLIFGKIYAQSYDTAAFKCAADQVLQDAGVDLLFHASGAGVLRTAEGRIDALLLETKSGRVAVRGKTFIDCSGDADIVKWAGLAFEVGDEQGHTLFPSLMFRIGNVDAERAGDAWRRIPDIMDAATAAGERALSSGRRSGPTSGARMSRNSRRPTVPPPMGPTRVR
jgi:hypothetical protein